MKEEKSKGNSKYKIAFEDKAIINRSRKLKTIDTGNVGRNENKSAKNNVLPLMYFNFFYYHLRTSFLEYEKIYTKKNGRNDGKLDKQRNR